jgi:DNA-directed RNA polymerase subunit M/transcription elongation factor TFIIS
LLEISEHQQCRITYQWTSSEPATQRPARRLAPVHRRYFIPTIMQTPDPAAEWQQLSERYRQMNDDDLLALARQSFKLTDVAQQTLASEMSIRRLKLRPEEVPTPPIPSPQAESVYDEDRELVEIRTVWSLADAIQLQALLDRAGIPFFLGPEKATDVGELTSNFSKGISVQVMNIGLWARQALMNYTPANEPPPEPEEELGDVAVRCPKCHSTEVIFDRLVDEATNAPDASPKFEWTCDSCGHRWEDDAVEKGE